MCLRLLALLGLKRLLAVLSLVVVVVIAYSSIVIVHQGDAAIVEKLGVFEKELAPGLHLVLPVVYCIRWQGSIREQVLDIPPQGCVTSDNANIKADAVVYWKITEPLKYVYEVQDAILAIQNMVLTQLRGEIGSLTLDETFNARSKLNQTLLKEANDVTASWGVLITRVEVRDITPNAALLKAMELQMAAERNKRAQVIESEGKRLALVNDATGRAEALKIQSESEKTAKILAAEGERERCSIEAEGSAIALQKLVGTGGLSHESARQFQMLSAYIDSQATIAASQNTKVLMFPTTEQWAAKVSAVLGEASSVKIAGAGLSQH